VQVLSQRGAHDLWRLVWGGFWLDEAFARVLESAYRRVLVVPAALVLDKWVSTWMGAPLAKAVGTWLSGWVFMERASVGRVLNGLLAAVLVSALFVGQLAILV
jgi:hypothetical protein